MFAFLTSPVALWGFAAATVAVILEYLYKTHTNSWIEMAHVFVPMQVAISYCLWRLLNSPGMTLVDSFIVFSFSTIALRLFVSGVVLHETIAMGSWVALALMFVGRYTQMTWR